MRGRYWLIPGNSEGTLHVPCIKLGEKEWVETPEEGWNVLVGAEIDTRKGGWVKIQQNLHWPARRCETMANLWAFEYIYP